MKICVANQPYFFSIHYYLLPKIPYTPKLVKSEKVKSRTLLRSGFLRLEAKMTTGQINYIFIYTPIYAPLFFSEFCSSLTLISRTEALFLSARPIAAPAASPMQQTTGIILYDACAP